MANGEPETLELLERWHRGDRQALDRLLERDLPWIRDFVHRRMGPLLRAKEETDDVIQETALELLRYGPRFALSSREHFRALLARMVENVLRGQHDRFTAYKRAASREQPLTAGQVLHLGRFADSAERPSRLAEAAEWQSLVRLGLELLAPEDREVILLREWDGLSFAEVGSRAGVTEEAARKRFTRALVRLTRSVTRLRRGELDGFLADAAPDA